MRGCFEYAWLLTVKYYERNMPVNYDYIGYIVLQIQIQARVIIVLKLVSICSGSYETSSLRF